MDKRQKKMVSVFLVLFCLLLFAYFRWHKEPNHSVSFFAMDTFFEITSKDDRINNQIKNEIEDLVIQIDKKINAYNPLSEIAQLNQNAGIKKIKVSSETFKNLKTAYQFSVISEGLFDVTFKPLQDLYGFENGMYKIPEQPEIEKAKQKVNYKKMILEEKDQSVFLTESGMQINLSGFMKGYVLDKVKQFLDQREIKNYFLNFGGNLYIHAASEEQIGIKHPRQDNIIFSFPLKEGFVSTSADYQQYFEKNNQRYTHIVNPLTGSSQQKLQTMTVVCESGILSDFLSTTLFLLDPKDIEQKLLKMDQKIEYYAFDGKTEYKSKWRNTP
jgi:thiamine biosynthesis lipoprotein